MTVPKPEKLRDVYAGPKAIGETDAISFPYKEVEYIRVATKTDTLVLNTDYEVQGQNIKYLVEIPEGETIVIYRQTPIENDAEFPQEAEFDSAKIGDSFDKLTMIVQEQQDALNRAIQLPTYIAPEEGVDAITPSPEAGKSLKWDTTGTYLVNTKYELDSIGEIAEQASKDAKTLIDTVRGYEENTYSKTEINQKLTPINESLANKQDKISVGAHLEMDATGTGIAVDLGSIMEGMTEYTWNQKTQQEKENIPLALIYE